MPTTPFPFASGSAPTAAYGQKTKVRFSTGWQTGENWTLQFTSTITQDFTLGKGNIAGANPTCGLKLRNRMYIGCGENFNLSAVEDPAHWEEQNAGAAKISYVSQSGQQDQVVALSTLQGRLAVLGSRSVQIWSVDADPTQLALLQSLENTGALSSLSVKSVGDYDVMYLDRSGIRSLRAKEVTLNAYVNDIGTAIDLTIREALIGFDASAACAVVDPTTYQYWLYLNGNIYVLSNYPESKVVAWSTYKATTETTVPASFGVYTTVAGGLYYWQKDPGGVSLTCGSTVLTASGVFQADFTQAVEVGATGTLYKLQVPFTPEKFVVYLNQIYVRATDGKVYQYGGSSNNVYDHTQVTVELPFLDLKEPATVKQGMGVDVAMAGAWEVQASMNPRASGLVPVISRGSATDPSMLTDSTFDVGHFNYSGSGTHIKLKALSGFAPVKSKLGKITFLYNPANKK